MSRPLIDFDARRTAATEFDRNLVVEAGAGTGKTSLLVERVLNLVLSGTTGFENLVAITFTEKAAAEMQERIAEALEDLEEAVGSGTPPPEKRESGRTWRWLAERGMSPQDLATRIRQAQDELDRATISTIHAFCSDLIRRYPMEAGIPPEFDIGSRAERRAAIDETWSTFLAREMNDQGPRAAMWSEVLTQLPLEQLEPMAEQIALSPVACDAMARHGYRGVRPAEFAPRVRVLRQRLQGFLTDKVIANFRATLTALLTLLDALEANGITGMREATTPGIQQVLDKKAGTPGKGSCPDPKAVSNETDRIRQFLKRLADSDESLFVTLGKLLQPFCEDVRSQALERGLLDYEDLLLLARNLLRDHPRVLVAEAARIHAILLDEFQDTDPLQYEILFLLLGEKAPDDSPAEPTQARPQMDLFAAGSAPANPVPVTGVPSRCRLFIVGDPKQSVYRFRGADMAAYAYTVERLLPPGDSPLHLQTNFRSVRPVIDAVNILFTDWMGEGDDPSVEPRYVPIEGHEDGPPGVEIVSVPVDPTANAEDKRHAEARVVAAEILALRRADPDLRFRDIALLHRVMTQVQIFVRALREAGIPFVVDGGKAFAQRHEIVESVALLRAFANPSDAVSTLAVLRSSLGAVPDGILAAYARAGGPFRWDIRSEVESRFPKVARVFDHLRRLDRETRHLTVDRRIHRLLTEGAFLIVSGSYFEGPQRVANIRKLADRAAMLAREHGTPMEQTLETLHDEFLAENVEGESPLADERLDAVRVLSVHRAKGLEFPVVFLPDLPKQDYRSDSDLRLMPLRSRDGYRLGLKAGKITNAAWALAERDEKLHSEAEVKRLLYVAMTRAKHRLLVVNSEAKRGTSWLQGLEGWNYLREDGYPEAQWLVEDLVRHRVVEGERLDPGEGSLVEPDLTPVLAFRSAREVAGRERPASHRTPSSDHGPTAEPVSSTEASTVDLARAVGIAVHHVLQEWDFRTTELTPLVEAAVGLGASREVPAAHLQREVEVVLNAVRASDLPQRLAASRVLAREAAALFRDPEGVTVHGYVDLIYEYEGQIHVADYKTDRALTAQAARDRYGNQLADYAFAVQHALGLPEPPVKEILLLRTGERITLP